jgi:drug/metabolite transporter (DMT)-like permease
MTMAAHRVDERAALLCALAAITLWSTVATGFKLGLRVLDPAPLLLLGSAISLLFFALVAVTTGRWRTLARLDRPTLLGCAGLGLLNPAGYYLVLFEAYDRLPAQIAQPLNYTWAITLALLAVPLLRQPLGTRALAGLLIAYAGVGVLVGGAPGGPIDGVGVALALGSTVIWALYWLATVRVTTDVVVLMTVSFATGTAAIAGVCAATTEWPVLTPATLGFGAWVGLVEMGVTFLLWRTALARTAHAARIAQLIFLSPFVSLLVIDRVLGENVRGTSIIGLALIVAGLIVTQRRSPPSHHNLSAEDT